MSVLTLMNKENNDKLWTKSYIIAIVIQLCIALADFMLYSTIGIFARGLTSMELYIGLVTGMFSFASLITRFITGPVLDRFSKKAILVIGIALCLISSVGYFFSYNVYILIVMRIINGFGYGLASAAIATMVSTMLPPKRLLEGVGYSMMFMTLCGAVGPTIVLNITDSDPTKFGIVFWICVAVSILGLFCAFVINAKPRTEIAEAAAIAIKGKIESGFSLATATMMSLTFFLGITHSSILACLNLYAMDNHLGNMSLFFIIFALVNFTTRLLMNRIVNLFSERRVLIASTAVMMLSYLGIFMADSAVQIFILAVPFGIVMGFYYPMMSSKTLKTMSEHRQGTSNTLRMVAEDLAFTLGAVFWGVIAGMIGGYRYIYLMSAGFAALMLLIVLIYPTVLKKCNIREDVWIS